jgi:DNA (cytosine-5)-methyltransferase 1
MSAYVNSHLTRFSKIAVALRPMAVAIENVPIAGETGRFAAFVERLEAVGYVATYGIVNAALRGSAQCRHRLLYVGIREDIGVAPVIPPATHGGGRYYSYGLQRLASIGEDRMAILSEPPGARRVRDSMPYRDDIVGRRWIPTVDDVIGDMPAIGTKKAKGMAHVAWMHSPKLIRRMGRVREGGRWRGGEDHYSHAYGRLHRRGLARTITTYFSNAGSGRFWHPTQDRAISLREAARLQGFEDSFRFLPAASVASSRLIGNALDARLAEVVFQCIRQALE